MKAHLIRGAFYVLLLVSVSTIPFALGQRQTRDQKSLTFEERVSYQRAIEEVYWRHRIWPKENSGPKPSLDAVMSQAQLEKKVADYLRKSQALEDYWQRPITARQLQAEMDRMAKNTKQPEVLQELFDALGNDPFVIAECLARPVLAQRLTTGFSLQDKTGHLESARVYGLRNASTPRMGVTTAYNLPTISEGDPPCSDDGWTATSDTNMLTGRIYHTAVWTGSEMIVWGGFVQFETMNDGSRYNPATDSWTATRMINAPSERCLHTAVWTGSEMVIWGGSGVLLGEELNTGGRYNPSTDSWIATSVTNAPAARYFHTGVWSGKEMIVWGGYSGGINGNQLNTGGKYNPETDSWTSTSTTNAPSARQEHTAIWTEGEMIVWGGYLFDNNSHFLNTGGRYNPTTDGWTGTSTADAPTGRRDHTAVWTGRNMIVWGGQAENFVALNTGGLYDPATNNWTATSTTDAPTPRYSHTAVWSDNEMVIWSGQEGSNTLGTEVEHTTPNGPPTPSPTPTPIPTPPIPGTGGRYDPVMDSWRATSIANAASERTSHTAIWTGSEMIVWGGSDLNGYLNSGGRYCVQSEPTPTPTPTITATPSLTPTPTETCVVTSVNTCDSVVSTPPTDFTVNVSCPIDPFSGCQAAGFSVNNVPADSCTVSDPAQVTFHFNTSPVLYRVNTIHILGAVSCCLRGLAEFTCTFGYEGPRSTPTPRTRPSPRPRP
jgi:N-acetylneuraminic acid mutarotase